jgi:hypothetical protein
MLDDNQPALSDEGQSMIYNDYQPTPICAAHDFLIKFEKLHQSNNRYEPVRDKLKQVCENVTEGSDSDIGNRQYRCR